MHIALTYVPVCENSLSCLLLVVMVCTAGAAGSAGVLLQLGAGSPDGWARWRSGTNCCCLGAQSYARDVATAYTPLVKPTLRRQTVAYC